MMRHNERLSLGVFWGLSLVLGSTYLRVDPPADSVFMGSAGLEKGPTNTVISRLAEQDKR